jgi:hypothetical protein
VPTAAGDRYGKAHRGVGLRVVRCTVAIGGYFGVVETREVADRQ